MRSRQGQPLGIYMLKVNKVNLFMRISQIRFCIPNMEIIPENGCHLTKAMYYYLCAPVIIVDWPRMPGQEVILCAVFKPRYADLVAMRPRLRACRSRPLSAAEECAGIHSSTVIACFSQIRGNHHGHCAKMAHDQRHSPLARRRTDFGSFDSSGR